MKPILTIFAACVLATNDATAGTQVNDLSPDPSLWSVKKGISIEAVCYTDLENIGVTESDSGAVIRVYLLNGRDHPVFYFGTDIDYGFEVTGFTSSGQAITLHSRVAMGGRRVELNPKIPRAYNIVLSKHDLEFLKNQQLTISAKIGDKTTGEIMIVQAPLELK